jgi:dihydrofolate reductase
MVNLVAAMARNRVIGRGNKIPWHLPADLGHFKRVVEGKTVLFGENTYKSVMAYYEKSGRPVPYGKIIVLSDDPAFEVSGNDAVVIRSVEEGLELAETEEIYICGGMGVYRTFLPYADRLEITWVEADVEGDAYFPEIDFSSYREVSRRFREKDERNEYDMSFAVYERKDA